MRAIGRWSLTALVVNVVLGSGIFGLPDDVARLAGNAAPWVYLIAAAGIGLIMSCFAEVASQFREAGGPYLYARSAFGRFAGVQMAWFAWLVRLTSAAANANLFVVYLGEFVTGFDRGLSRTVALTLVLGFLGFINVRGVKSGTDLSNALLILKLLPLVMFIGAGFALVGDRIQVGTGMGSGTGWLQATLILIFAYGGFEAATMPMSEARDPRRDAPFALLVGLAAITGLYLLVHLVFMGAITDPDALLLPEVQERPVAQATRVFLGPWGSILISLGVLLSTYGNLTGQFVTAPRLTYALAEQQDFPSFFAAVHQRFRTPYVSILIHTVLVWALAVYGSFIWNALFSAVARLFTYALVCGALLVLRKRRPQADAFRLPCGTPAAVAAILFCFALVTEMGRDHFIIIAAITFVAASHWWWVGRRNPQPPGNPQGPALL